MLAKLILLFTLVPIVELYILIKISELVGIWTTVIIVLATGLLGVLLARAQGFLVLADIVNTLRRGELPGNELFSGVLVLLGAAFLLTPGLLTDTAGFLMLIPASRGIIRRLLLRKLKKALDEGKLPFFRR